MKKEDFNLLIVDDEEGIRKNLKMHFELDDYNVFTADSGRSAIEIVKNNRIDFVITDILMPNGTGEELLDQIREFNKELPVVVMVTGFAHITRDEAIKKGALDLLAKPVDMNILEGYIEQQLGITE